MARRTAFDGQDASGREHAVNVVGPGKGAHHDHVGSFSTPSLGRIGVENHPSDGGPRRGVDSAAQQVSGVPGRILGTRRERRVRKHVDILGTDPEQRFVAGDTSLLAEIHRNANRRSGCSLPGSRLQDPELAPFDGELHVLHVTIPLFQLPADPSQLPGDSRHPGPEIGDPLRIADSGHDVLSLRVGKVVAVESPGSGHRISRKDHTRTGIEAHIPEDHGDDVDRRPQAMGNARGIATVEGAFAVPATKDRLNRHPQLFEGVLRKLHAGLRPDDPFEICRQLLPVRSRQICVRRRPPVALQPCQKRLECFVAQLQHHTAEHLDQTTIGVERKPIVSGAGRQPRGRLVVESHVEHRIHHSGYGVHGAGTTRDEQRVLPIAEALAAGLLDPVHGLQHLVPQPLGKIASRAQVLDARFRGDDETRWHRQADAAHLGQARTLPAQQSPQRLLVVMSLRGGHFVKPEHPFADVHTNRLKGRYEKKDPRKTPRGNRRAGGTRSRAAGEAGQDS